MKVQSLYCSVLDITLFHSSKYVVIHSCHTTPNNKMLIEKRNANIWQNLRPINEKKKGDPPLTVLLGQADQQAAAGKTLIYFIFS